MKSQIDTTWDILNLSAHYAIWSWLCNIPKISDLKKDRGLYVEKMKPQL